jgi:thiol-disulfide isomerase/thioredoxin
MDACDEPVRLHDLAGAYLLLTKTAVDCPPCQLMADLEGAFVEEMAADGLDVRVVTLVVPSLSAIHDAAGTALLQTWTDNFDLPASSPVLADRAFLESLLPAFAEAYPANVLVAPDLQVLDVLPGFQGYDDYADAIRDHAGL